MGKNVHVELVQADGSTLIAKGTSGHWVTMDTAPEFDGHAAAATPFELVFIGLAGCSAMDVLSVLKKMREPFRKLRVQVDVDRRDEHPRVATAVKMHYILEGENINEENFKKAISLSQEKYCSVSGIIRLANIPIEWTYEIVQPIA